MTDPGGEGSAVDLDRWLDATFGGPEGIAAGLPVASDADRSVLQVGAPGTDDHAVANRPRGSSAGNDDLARFVRAWNGLPGERPADRWRLLSVEAKQALRDGWTRYEADADLQRAAEADSIVPELVGPTPERRQPPDSVVPERSDPLLAGPTPADRPTDPAAPRRGPSTVVIGVLAAVGVLVAIALALLWALSGGDDDVATDGPTPTSTTTTTSGEDGGDGTLPIDLLAGDRTATYQGPTTVAAGATVEATVRVVDANGAPVAGTTWFLTIGDPPSSPDATHAEATTDADGVATFVITAPSTTGASALWTSDGDDAWEVAPVEITEG